MIVMESLQMAQMVADLSALETARNDRARALLQANKEAEAAAAAAATTAAAAAASAPATPAAEAPPSTTAEDPSRPAAHRRGTSTISLFSPASASSTGAGTASPFDSYLGRFLSPALTRTNSSHGTGINTPQTSSAHAADADRASSMAALQELRTKLKQYNDSTSLRQARDKVAALAAHRHAAEQAAAGASSARPTSDPAPSQQPLLARRNSQYTFPRE